MKVKLLKKVRKQYQIYYREEPYHVCRGTKGINRILIGLHYSLVTPDNYDSFHYDINEAKEKMIMYLRYRFPKLGHYNRQREIKETEHKVWFK